MGRDRGWPTPDRGDRRRDELVRAGMDVVLEQGWSRATMRAVAERAGAPPSLISYHFGTMAVLRRAVVVELLDQLLLPVLQRLTAQRDWRDGVVAVLRGCEDDAEAACFGVPHHGDLYPDDLAGAAGPWSTDRHVLADVIVAAMCDAVLSDLVRDSLSHTREQVRRWLERTGVPEERAEGTSLLMVALLDGLLLHHHVDPDLPLGLAVDAVPHL